MLAAVVADLNQLATEGIPTENGDLYFCVVAMKGDITYMYQSFNLTRPPGKEEICWRCAASRGASDFSLVYTDISPRARWRFQMIGDPWDARPVLADLWGFDPQRRMLGIDLLHVLNLGVLRDLCGSCLKVLLKPRGYFAGNNLAARFRSFNRDPKTWLKRTKTPQLQVKYIKKSTLVWKSDSCPELHLKGADTAQVLRYLAQLTQASPPQSYPAMTACLWAISNFLGILMSAEMFLTDEERESGFHLGSLFLRSYLHLANEAIAAGDLLFKARPKIHYLQHVIDDLQWRKRNPAKDATWMDEDLMKHTFRMRKRMSHRTSPLNVLRRYSVVLRANLDKIRKTR